MTTITQGYLVGEWLISEADGTGSRDTATVTVAGAVALPSGTVLGKVTATGKYLKHSTAAVDGSQNAAAILLTDLPGTNGDYSAVIFARDTEAISAILNGGTGPLTGAAASLLALGIVLR